MRFRRTATDRIARERLKMMVEAGPISCTAEQMAQMKKEISEILARYIDVTMEDYEVKVLLRQKQKRA